MCILAIAWRAHPAWPLVVAANRDEYHDRAAAPLARWPDSGVIAGRDLIAGGTWLGVSDTGRFAAVTNLRGYPVQAQPAASRGRLIGDLLSGGGAYADPQTARLADFNPFNAIAITGDEGIILANRPDAMRRPLSPGVHALSNGPLDTSWEKTTRLTEAVERWLNDPSATADVLLTVLRDPERPGGAVGDTDAIFVADPRYGTRCSTVVTIDQRGRGVITERRYGRDTAVTGESSISWS